MKLYLTLFFLLSIHVVAFSQQNDPKIDSMLQKDIREGQPIISDYRQPIRFHSPLYIVDGKEIALDKINDINPNDIESIHVLKGKEATDLYFKGENGVVIIKLKNPKNGLPTKPRGEDL